MSELSGVVAPLVQSPTAPEELLPIREVVRLTGVNPVTLRAWERRYGLIQPVRTNGGHRLYSRADIEAIRSIQAWIGRGVAVSKVGGILARRAASQTAQAEERAGSTWSEWQSRLRQAVSHFDELRLEQLYGQLCSSCPLPKLFEEVFLPLWQELLHQEGFGQLSQWLFLDAFLRVRLLSCLRPGGGRVLAAAIPDGCRELELLAAGLLLDGNGGSVGVLPLGQPLEELSLVCRELRPPALVLYTRRPLGGTLLRRLGKLALALDCPLALAGEASELNERELSGTPIACLGSSGPLMARRLAQFLAGHLDS